MPLPHISNSKAGVNKYEPVHTCIFELYFTLPEAIKSQFNGDVAELTEQITQVDGLGTLDAAPERIEQKFMGTSRGFISPVPNQTYHEITLTLNLNLRNAVDNYIYKIFKAWNNLGYNLATGERSLKTEYCAEWIKLVVGNRKGDIHREVIFKDCYGVISDSGQNTYNYDTADAASLQFKFWSDWATETNV